MSLSDLKKQFYRTTGEYKRHQGKLLTKVAPEYFEVCKPPICMRLPYVCGGQ